MRSSAPSLPKTKKLSALKINGNKCELMEGVLNGERNDLSLLLESRGAKSYNDAIDALLEKPHPAPVSKKKPHRISRILERVGIRL